MDKYKVIEIKQSVFEDNDRQADLLREELKKEKTFLLNLMSSPGSGKTTTVLRTIEALKNEMNIGILYITHKINYMLKQSLSITVSGIELTQ